LETPRNVTGPVYGYRGWRLRGPALFSFSGRTAWPDDEPKLALCWRNLLPLAAHIAPGVGHNCGLYAWKEPPSKVWSPRGMTTVWGVVELVGKVVVHSLGYRAQYARPVAVEYAPGIEAAVERYGLVVLQGLRDWKAFGEGARL
jgi:hypothetical protein